VRALVNPQTLGLVLAAYIVQVVYVAAGRSAIDNLVVAGYDLIFHPAIQNRRELLFRHPLVIAVLSGLILGLLPFHAIASGAGFISKPNGGWSRSWLKVKPWIAIPFALGFLLGVSSYIAAAPANALPVWRSFFAASCNLDAVYLLVYRNGCANQLLFTAPLTCALVYSLTGLFDRRRHSVGQEPLLKTPDTTGEIV
jgi:hypothetical protein